ncbi:MAG: major facilitator superfamily 1, partial [Labilithrix sp.]|nr:major facilitator superfamily 1 [Labilithrix sp.]
MTLTSDSRILFATRAVRTFAYGLLAVILALYLAARGFSNAHIGLIFTLTLVGDAVFSLAIAGVADRFGRRRVLLGSCVLVVLAGVAFVSTGNAILLTIAATIGTISPSGAEVGPFLSIEQAALSQEVAGTERTRVFGYYQLAGSLSNALGALAGGWIARLLTTHGHTELDAFRVVILLYSALGVVMACLFLKLSPEVEPKHRAHSRIGLHHSRRAVTKLAALFAVDSFGSGLAVQTLLAYWLHRRFGADVGLLGSIFFATNAIAGFSALLSAPLAKR